MNAVGTVLFLAAGLLAAPAASAGERCEVSGAGTVAELQRALNLLAVEVVRRAGAPGAERDERLQQLVAPSAIFSLGAGDVGRPLGTGVSGARALAQAMKAQSFRFLGWDFIPTPVTDACGTHKVEIEFVDAANRNVYPTTFTFDGARVVAATGWSRSFESGPLEPAGN